MTVKQLNQSICLKEFISKKEYKEINELMDICHLQDKTNLKLELEYKLNITKNSEIGLTTINEFLYYIDGVLVSYLGISSFGGNINEVNGMTHPAWRRKGIFKKLFTLAIEQCSGKNINKLLLLTDGKSGSGIQFIKEVGGGYDFSEFRMKIQSKTAIDPIKSVNLRKANKLDGKEIGSQNAIYFDDLEDSENYPEIEEILNEITYMVELKGETIGKIKVDYSDKSSFIHAFGILPDFRGKGYGRAALKETLRLINGKNIYDVELDVECKNNAALNLYKACGFEEKSIMNYYKLSL
ncbi:MAG TPA: GNAT family N-acetyltransferase [Clostridiaceae bacterium]